MVEECAQKPSHTLSSPNLETILAHRIFHLELGSPKRVGQKTRRGEYERRTFLRNGAASGLVAAVVPGVASSSESKPADASGTKVREISTNRAPKPVGPFSQAIKANGLIFVAGQTARDPQSGQVIEGDITVQTERVMEKPEGHSRSCRFVVRSDAEDNGVPEGYGRF
jgi:hypothetical protein